MTNWCAFVLIDAMRLDVLSDAKAAAQIAPNLAQLARSASVHRVIANGQATQFVLPSLFSLSYPLDHGAYNRGMRNRPRSFVEQIQAAGYTTHLVTYANQIGFLGGFDRGFTYSYTYFDYASLLKYLLERRLSYDVSLWRKGEIDLGSIVQVVHDELGRLLKEIDKIERDQRRLPQPRRIRHRNARVVIAAKAELELLKRNPEAVLRKIESLPKGVYWRFLGRENVGAIRLFLARIVPGLAWRIKRVRTRLKWVQVLFSSYNLATLRDVMPSVNALVDEETSANAFLYLHVMDVHDHLIANRLQTLFRLRYLPRWVRARRQGLTRRSFMYDSAIMEVDTLLGRLLQRIRLKSESEPILLITSDHGSSTAHSPRQGQVVGMRTYGEDIEVPMILTGVRNRTITTNKLVDSMGVTATLLDAMGVPPHQSFKGISAFRGGRDFVITESAGSGSADLARKDLYFTVTTRAHKLMTVLKEDELRLLHLYDLGRDPEELNDLIGGEDAGGTIGPMLDALFAERGAVLSERQAKRPKIGNVEKVAL